MGAVTMLVVVAWAGDAACTAPVSALELVQRVDRVEAAYRELVVGEDEEAAWRALSAASRALEAGVPCLAAPLTPVLAGRVHRALGLVAFADQRPEQAERAFAAARRASPGLGPPEGVRSTDPEARAHGALALSLGWETPVPAPRGGRLVWDGREGSSRPGPWPVIVQLVDDRVRWSARLEAADPVPAYARRAPPSAWGVVGVGAGVAAVGMGLAAGGLGLFDAACADGPQAACGAHGGRTPEQVAGTVAGLVNAGAALVGVGVAGAVAGGVWVGLAARPREVEVAFGGHF